jgi:hypothetical protein
MNEDQDYCLQSKKTSLGLVHSAREIYKETILMLKSIDFVENKSDPFLLSNWNREEVIVIGIYVDDCLIIGKEERIQSLILELKRSDFNLNVENNLKDHLTCHITQDKELKHIMIFQPNSIKICETSLMMRCFKREPTGLLEHQGFKVVRPDQD